MGVFFGAKRARGAGAPGSHARNRAGWRSGGKKLAHDGFVRAGVVHRSNARAGDRPSDAQQRTSARRIVTHARRTSCKGQSRSARLRSQRDRNAATADLEIETDARYPRRERRGMAADGGSRCTSVSTCFAWISRASDQDRDVSGGRGLSSNTCPPGPSASANVAATNAVFAFI